MSKTKIKQHCILTAIIATAFLAFCVLGGDDLPGQPMSWSFFIGSKVIALMVIILCILVGKICRRKGLLPEPTNIESEPEDGWED